MSIFSNAHDFQVNNSQFIDQSLNYSFNISISDIPPKSDRPGLQKLLEYSIPEATHDSSARYPPPLCHPGTRDEYINQLKTWSLNENNHPQRIAWVRGPAGVGKSAIAQSCAEALGNKLVASFFFSRPNQRTDPKKFFPTLAHQIAVDYDAFGELLDQKIRRNPTILKKSLPNQFRDLILLPLRELGEAGNGLGERVIFVDGLDECDGNQAQEDIVKIIAKSTQAGSTPFLWIFFSRLEPHLVSTFELPTILPLTTNIELSITRDLDPEILLYLTEKLAEIGHKNGLPAPWPSERDIWKLVELSAGLFAYAHTVVLFIEDENSTGPVHQLETVLRSERSAASRQSQDENPLARLDSLYTLILERIPPKKLDLLLWMLFSNNTISIYYEYAPPTVAIGNMLGLPEQQLVTLCASLSSVMTIGPDKNFQFYHASFMDFLYNESRSKQYCIWGDCTISFLDKAVQLLNRVEIKFAEETRHLAPEIPLPWPAPDIQRQRLYRNAVEAFFFIVSSSDSFPASSAGVEALKNFDFRKIALFDEEHDGNFMVPVSKRMLFKSLLPTGLLVPLKRRNVLTLLRKAALPWTKRQRYFALGQGEKKSAIFDDGDDSIFSVPYSKRKIESFKKDLYEESQRRQKAQKGLDSSPPLCQSNLIEGQPPV